MRAVYAASATGALPAGVGSMRSAGIFDGLASLGLSISGGTGGGSPMSAATRQPINGRPSHNAKRLGDAARVGFVYSGFLPDWLRASRFPRSIRTSKRRHGS